MLSGTLSVCRFQHDRERPAESPNNMRRLLTHLQNLPLKRKIATDLGLSDVLQSLSPTQDEGFLNDIARLVLVWVGVCLFVWVYVGVCGCVSDGVQMVVHTNVSW